MQAGADRIERFAHAVHIAFQFGDLAAVGGEKGIFADKFFALESDGFFAHLRNPADDFGAEALAQPFFGNGAGGHAGGGFTGGTSAAAAVVADAVFVPVAVVGVAGAELLGDGAVVFAALVGVADQQGDGSAGGFALEDAGKDFHAVGFAALGNVAAGAGFAAVEIGLDVVCTKRQAGRAAVDNAADGFAVAFAKSGDAEQLSERIACHRVNAKQKEKRQRQPEKRFQAAFGLIYSETRRRP